MGAEMAYKNATVQCSRYSRPVLASSWALAPAGQGLGRFDSGGKTPSVNFSTSEGRTGLLTWRLAFQRVQLLTH